MTQFENPNRQGQAKEDRTWSKWAIDKIAGTYDDIAAASAALREAATHCHLIGGAAIPCIPEGHELQVVVVPVDVAECYEVNKRKEGMEAKVGDGPPKFGIPKHILMRIASAAGAEWVESKRIDNGRDARFVHWRVVLRYPLVDGTFRYVEGDRDVDLRDNSDQIANKTEKELPRLRENIMRAAITKAKLRVIREAFGIAHGLTEKQLERPFVIARAVFTGRSKDKENARMFAGVIAQKQLMAANALYGGGLLSSAARAALLPTAASTMMLPHHQHPVAIGQDPDLSFNPTTGEVADIPRETSAPRVETQPQPCPVAHVDEPHDPPPPPPPPRADGPVTPNMKWVPAFGRGKGLTLKDQTEDNLNWYEKTIASDLDSPEKARFLKANMTALAGIRAELKTRGVQEPPTDSETSPCEPLDDLPF